MRLLTYNIHKGVGGSDRRYRLERVLEVIRAEEPDLICLQEVDYNCKRTNFDNQPAILADRLRVSASLYQLNHPHKEGGYGNLILSRWPFRAMHHMSMRHGKRKNRGAQMVVVESPHGPVHVVNWHLGLGEKERRWQVSRVLEHTVFQQFAHLPTLIVGDYNDWRNTLGKHRFAAHWFEQVTDPVGCYRSFPAFFAVASLDKVYRRGALDVQRAGTVKTRQARRASDHLPLVVDFKLHNGVSQPSARP